MRPSKLVGDHWGSLARMLERGFKQCVGPQLDYYEGLFQPRYSVILLKKKDSANCTKRKQWVDTDLIWSGLQIQENGVSRLRKSCNFIILANFSVIRHCQYP